MRRAMGLLCGVAMLLGSQGSAEAKGLTIGQLKALVKDLGYEATSDDKSYVSLPDQGKWGKNVFISLHDEGETLEIYSNFGELPDASKTVIPFADLLAANDDERFVFAIGRSDGKPSLFLEGQLAAATVNKQVLRKTIDSWLVRIDATEPTWNSDHWAAAAPAASPAAAAATPPVAPVPVAPVVPAAAAASPRKIFCDRSVEKDPLKLQNVSFRKGAMGEEGGDVARPGSVFGAEEPMYVELDVSGFLCSSLDKDRYQALFTIDQGIKGSDDPDFEPFGSMSQTLEFDTSKPVDLALLRVTITPHWKAAGKYTFRYIVHDNIKGTEASTAIPFTIDLAKQAVK